MPGGLGGWGDRGWGGWGSLGARDFEDAVKDLTRAAKLSPKDKAIRKKLKEAKAARALLVTGYASGGDVNERWEESEGTLRVDQPPSGPQTPSRTATCGWTSQPVRAARAARRPWR